MKFLKKTGLISFIILLNLPLGFLVFQSVTADGYEVEKNLIPDSYYEILNPTLNEIKMDYSKVPEIKSSSKNKSMLLK